MRTRTYSLLQVGLLLCLLAAASGAIAADDSQLSSIFAPHQHDIASDLLDRVFGTTKDATTSVSAFAAVIRVLNWAALGFGVALFSYIAIVGTMRSAEDGELLGKKWSSMWILLRFTMVCGLMVPGASGYSTGQMGMLWLAKAGSGAADVAWYEAAHYLTGGGDVTASMFNNPGYATARDSAMRSVWAAETCSEAVRQAYSFDADRFGLHYTKLPDGAYQVQWGDSGGSLLPALCGSITTSSPSLPTTNGHDSQGYFGLNGTPPTAGAEPPAALYNATLSQQVVTAQLIALRTAASMLRPTAQHMVSDPSDPANKQAVEEALAAAGEAYTTEMRGAVANLVGSALTGSQMLQQTTKSGWALAGTSLFSMARVQSSINKVSAFVPQVTPPTQDQWDSMGTVGAIDAASVSWNNAIAQRDQAHATGVGRSLAQYVARKLAIDPNDSRHALVQLKDTGDSIMGWTEGIAAAIGATATLTPGGQAAASLVAKADSIPFLGSIMKEAAGAAVTVAITLFVMGVILSLILPMLPFVIWMGSLLGWVIAVGEAIAAAPVWLAAHLHPEGDDLTGKANGGYMVLLEVAMRPIFMVIGLVFCFTALDAFLRFAGYCYWSAADQVQDDSITGLVSIIVLVGLYVAMVWTITRMSYGLIHDLPSTIGRWIGGQHATFDKGQSFSQANSSQVASNMGKLEAGSAKALGYAAAGLRRRPAAPADDPDDDDGSAAGPRPTSGNRRRLA